MGQNNLFRRKENFAGFWSCDGRRDVVRPTNLRKKYYWKINVRIGNLLPSEGQPFFSFRVVYFYFLFLWGCGICVINNIVMGREIEGIDNVFLSSGNYVISHPKHRPKMQKFWKLKVKKNRENKRKKSGLNFFGRWKLMLIGVDGRPSISRLTRAMGVKGVCYRKCRCCIA